MSQNESNGVQLNPSQQRVQDYLDSLLKEPCEGLDSMLTHDLGIGTTSGVAETLELDSAQIDVVGNVLPERHSDEGSTASSTEEGVGYDEYDPAASLDCCGSEPESEGLLSSEYCPDAVSSLEVNTEEHEKTPAFPGRATQVISGDEELPADTGGYLPGGADRCFAETVPVQDDMPSVDTPGEEPLSVDGLEPEVNSPAGTFVAAGGELGMVVLVEEKPGPPADSGSTDLPVEEVSAQTVEPAGECSPLTMSNGGLEAILIEDKPEVAVVIDFCDSESLPIEEGESIALIGAAQVVDESSQSMVESDLADPVSSITAGSSVGVAPLADTSMPYAGEPISPQEGSGNEEGGELGLGDGLSTILRVGADSSAVQDSVDGLNFTDETESLPRYPVVADTPEPVVNEAGSMDVDISSDGWEGEVNAYSTVEATVSNDSAAVSEADTLCGPVPDPDAGSVRVDSAGDFHRVDVSVSEAAEGEVSLGASDSNFCDSEEGINQLMPESSIEPPCIESDDTLLSMELSDEGLSKGQLGECAIPVNEEAAVEVPVDADELHFTEAEEGGGLNRAGNIGCIDIDDDEFLCELGENVENQAELISAPCSSSEVVDSKVGGSCGVDECLALQDDNPAISDKVVLDNQNIEDNASAISTELPVGSAPAWVGDELNCVVVQVHGINIAVPMDQIESATALENVSLSIDVENDWILGQILSGDHTITYVLDSACWLMPELYDPVKADYKDLLVLQGGYWGIACDEMVRSVRIPVGKVSWAVNRSKRPWLLGTYMKERCAVLDVDALIDQLNAAF